MNFTRRVRRTIAKKKEQEERKMQEEMKNRERETAGILAGEMTECYAEIIEAEMSEEADDAVRELVGRMHQRKDFDEALGLLMVVFELAGKAEISDMMKSMSPDFLREYGRLMVRRLVISLGIDPDPTMELTGRPGSM